MTRYRLRLLKLALFLAPVFVFFLKANPALAGDLTLPFSGSPSVKQYFDHDWTHPPQDPEYPILRYDGTNQKFDNKHNGTDYTLDTGTPVLAAAAGIVKKAGCEVPTESYPCPTGGGLVVRIYHPALGYSTYYMHLNTESVSVDQNVSRGQQIGTSGCTGNCTGPHLHFTVWQGDSTSNPMDPYGWYGVGPDPWSLDKGRLWVTADVFSIKMNGTPQGKTELHILDGTKEYQSWFAQIVTPLEETNPNQWQFEVGDYNGDGWRDLFAIKMNGTGSGKTEVHILNGANYSYQTWILQTGTILHETTPSQFQFTVADYNADGRADLYAMKMNGTGSGKTEAHIMDGANNYQSYLINVATVLHPTTPDQFQFVAEGFDADARPEIFAIKMNGTGQGKTEVHIMNGANNYQTWLNNFVTILEETTPTQFQFGARDYNLDRQQEVFAIKMNGTGSLKTEVHILNGATYYQSWLNNFVTILEQTTTNQWQFSVK